MKNKLNKILVILSLTMALTLNPVLAKDHAYTRIVDKGYSFVVMPDSQTMVSRHPDIFAGMVEGIIKEKDDLDILALIHVGDIVNHHHIEEEFSFAASELNKVPAADIKTVVTPGNHDYTWLWDINNDKVGVTDQYYSKYFGPGSEFDNLTPYYKKDSPSKRSGYAHIETPGYDYMVLSVSWYDLKTNPEEQAWMEKVLRDNLNTPTILVSHNIVRPSRTSDQDLEFSWERNNVSDIIWDTIKKYDQIFLVFSGHHQGAGHMVLDNDLGNPVHFVLTNYQFSYNGGNGHVEYVEFDEANKKIHINTASPYLAHAYEGEVTEDDIIYGNHIELDFDFASRFDNLPVLTDYSFHWAAGPIGQVLQAEIMFADEDGSFKPDEPANRYEVVRALGRIEGLERHNHDGSSLSDVDSAYMAYVNWAMGKEIVLGYEDQTFKGEQNITREEMAAILNRYVTNLDKDIKPTRTMTYTDLDKISAWAREDVIEISNRGLLSGKEAGVFDPKAMVTRAELAQIVVNISK